MVIFIFVLMVRFIINNIIKYYLKLLLLLLAVMRIRRSIRRRRAVLAQVSKDMPYKEGLEQAQEIQEEGGHPILDQDPVGQDGLGDQEEGPVGQEASEDPVGLEASDGPAGQEEAATQEDRVAQEDQAVQEDQEVQDIQAVCLDQAVCLVMVLEGRVAERRPLPRRSARDPRQEWPREHQEMQGWRTC